MKYIKQLDSIRAIAVIFVLISHWMPSDHIINKTPNGAIGVNIFFVLSGFLITKILFDNRNQAEKLKIPKSTVLKNFFGRRSLRIFPIYYLTIFGIFLFAQWSGTNIRSTFVYYLTYTSNYLFYCRDWDGFLSHLWSLAVEEQFYLIWPWVILFANKKYFFHIIVVFISIGFLSQVLMRGTTRSVILTFTCFDAFGLGAMLSWVITYAKDQIKKFYLLISIAAGLSFAFFMYNYFANRFEFMPNRTIVSFITVWLITYILLNRDRNTLRFKFILNNRILIFLGKISYGLYLYHNLMPNLNRTFIVPYINPLLPEVWTTKYAEDLFMVQNTILLVAVSWLSYILIEKPFLNLKKHFEYRKEIDAQHEYIQKQGVPL